MAVTDRSYAQDLDSKDSLAKYRNEFVITDPDICYLDGNSLGRLPKRTITAINSFLMEEWGAQVVEGWGTWIDEAQKTGNLIGRAALGAAAGQVLACDTTSVNFYQLVGAALRARPGRKTIIIDSANFPTDRYILQGLADRFGLKLITINNEDGGEALHEQITPQILEKYLSEDVAFVTLEVIQYRSGARSDIKAITDLVRKFGALTIWDASHAVGAIEMDFDKNGVDLAVGCTYKYGNSGPGSPAWLYVSKKIQNELQVPIQGWFAQKDQFEMGPDFEKSADIRGFQIASPSIIGLRCINTAFEMINEVSVGAKIKAYAHHSAAAFDDGDDAESDHHQARADKIHAHILKHHGAEAAHHAEKAASAAIFGNGKSKSHGDSLSGGLRGMHSKSVTKAGKIPKNTQSAMKNSAKGSYGDRVVGPKGHLPEEVEQIDELTGKGKLSQIADYHKQKSGEAKDKMEKIRSSNRKLPVPFELTAKISAKDNEAKYHSSQEKRAKALMGKGVMSNVLKKVKNEEVEQLKEFGDDLPKIGMTGNHPGPFGVYHRHGKGEDDLKIVSKHKTLDSALKHVNKLTKKSGKNDHFYGHLASHQPDQGKIPSHFHEEVEQIDELKKSTLGSYVKSAARDASISRKIGADFQNKAEKSRNPSSKAASSRLADKFNAMAQKRHAGIGKAVERLTKEESVEEESIVKKNRTMDTLSGRVKVPADTHNQHMSTKVELKAEGWEDMMKAVKKQHDSEKGTGKFDKKKDPTTGGTVYTRKYNAKTGETDDTENVTKEKRGRGRPKKSAFEQYLTKYEKQFCFF